MKLKVLFSKVLTSILLVGASLTQLNVAIAADLPDSIANTVLENTSQLSGLPISDLQIIIAEPVTWPDGCLGIYFPNTFCTLALVDGWFVTVASTQQKQKWVYHTNNYSGVRLAYGPNVPINPPTIGKPIYPRFGTSQINPLLPDVKQPNGWFFQDVPNGLWYDPPTAYGFRYTMASDSLFTSILNFPIGIDDDNLFTVSVGETLLGQFSSGQSVDFISLLGSGVSEFSVTDINPSVDPEDSTAFPIQLGFDTPTASFSMEALSETEAQPVPEPTSTLGILVLGALGVGSRLRRKSRKSS